MRPYFNLYWAALTGFSDSIPGNQEEVRELQYRVWTDHHLMIISSDDDRLTDEDRIDLFRIGERLAVKKARSMFQPRRSRG